MKLEIGIIEFGTPEYDQLVRLRYRVLREPLGRDFTAEQLAAEFDDTFFGGFDEQGQLVGCLIFTKKTENRLKMRQVAVDFSVQGHGVGRQLVETGEAWAWHQGFSEIELNARENAIPFYEKLEYDIKTDWFEEVGIQHKMLLKVKKN